MGRGTRAATVQRGEGWLVASWSVAAALAPFVRRVEGYSERTPKPFVRIEHATPSVVLIVELGPPLRVTEQETRFRGGFFAGIGERSSVTAHDGFQTGIQVDLTPLGARRLLRRPLREIAGRCVALGDLLPPSQGSLPERLANLPGWDARFTLLEDVLFAEIYRDMPRGPLDVVAWACRRIEGTGGLVPMKLLTRELGYSSKHVVSLFDEHVGVAPKVFARIVRLDRLVRHLRAAPDDPWASLAARFGFCDQPHLAHEVKRMTGLTPTALRRALFGFEVPAGDLISVQDLLRAAP
jgi:AraC-like DNA-binding protein